MTFLILGLALFAITHVALSGAPNAVTTLRTRFGAGPVKGIVTLASLAGIGMIVLGWRGSTPQFVYTPTRGMIGAGLTLAALGVYGFVVANRPSAIKRFIRHPQLTGLAIWCSGHLLMNGDTRSLALFAGLGVWALIEIVLINRRDGEWERGDAPPLKTDISTAVIAIVAYVALVALHPWLAGVPVMFLT